jgi:hypothetical protein
VCIQHREIIIFMKLKINYKARYMLLHTCWSIVSFVLCGFDQNWKWYSNAFENWIWKLWKNKRKRPFLCLPPSLGFGSLSLLAHPPGRPTFTPFPSSPMQARAIPSLGPAQPWSPPPCRSGSVASAIPSARLPFPLFRWPWDPHLLSLTRGTRHYSGVPNLLLKSGGHRPHPTVVAPELLGVIGVSPAPTPLYLSSRPSLGTPFPYTRHHRLSQSSQPPSQIPPRGERSYRHSVAAPSSLRHPSIAAELLHAVVIFTTSFVEHPPSAIPRRPPSSTRLRIRIRVWWEPHFLLFPPVQIPCPIATSRAGFLCAGELSRRRPWPCRRVGSCFG